MRRRPCIYSTLAAIIVAILPFSVGLSAPNEGRIIVNLDKFRNNEGEVRIGLHDSPEGFPSTDSLAVEVKVVPIVDGKVRVVFENIAWGRYAIGVHHDENKNKKMDTNFLGIPSEGYGVSKNVDSSFGPPDFADAAFELASPELTLNITVKYISFN